MSTQINTRACLFISKDGDLAVRLLEPPFPEEYLTPEIPAGMLRAVRMVGLPDKSRIFKLSVEGALPVYEEIER